MPAPPGTTIPLRVWVVLGPTEDIGDRGNNGCRLTQAEITERVHHLQEHASLFGPNVAFQWSGTVTIALHDRLFYLRNIHWSFFHAEVVPNYWQSGALNIYFAGNYLSGSDPSVDYGMTVDPLEAQSLWPNRPWIVIDDAGWTEPYGFPPGHSPPEQLNHRARSWSAVLSAFTMATPGAG